MDNYSFLNHVDARLGEFIIKYGFSLNNSFSQISPGFQNNLLMYESQQCRVQIYLEHYRVYIEISALNVSDPNLWYNVDMMACFVSHTSPSVWIYNLPRGIPLSQVIEQQLVRWQKILESYFDKIIPLFASKDRLYEMQKILDVFVQDFYSEQKKISAK